jgi:VWFA-related protein
MKKLAGVAICLGILSLGIFAQTTKTRPRVVATPEPPTIKGGSTRGDRKPPVFKGANEPADEQPATETDDGEDDIIRVETNLVTMPVSVLDRNGRFVTGLTQRDFRIFEDGKEQKVDYFQSVEQPFTVILMIDVSPSTQYKIDEIQDAAIAFVDQLRNNDRVMVVAFDENTYILSEITNNRNELRNAIRQAQFGDGTSLYESVDRVINTELARIQGRKAVVLFTDGVDTTSRRANYQSTLADAEETDAIFYTIRYDTQRYQSGGGSAGKISIGGVIGILMGGKVPGGVIGGAPAGSTSAEYRKGKQYLDELSQVSGGRNFEATTLANLESAFSGIAEELRRQYSLGYYPETSGQPGDRRQIQIRVMKPNLVVRAKTSYIVGESGQSFATRWTRPK